MEENISIRYVLKKEEIYHALKGRGEIKTTGKRVWIETAILIVLAAVFFTMYFLKGENGNLIFGIVSVALLGIIWIVPEASLHRRAKKYCDGKTYELTFEKDAVYAQKGDSSLTIPLDGENTRYIIGKDVYMLLPTGGKMIVFPRRSIPEEDREKIETILREGAVSEKD